MGLSSMWWVLLPTRETTLPQFRVITAVNIDEIMIRRCRTWRKNYLYVPSKENDE